jgi:HlyD family secretion protein
MSRSTRFKLTFFLGAGLLVVVAVVLMAGNVFNSRAGVNENDLVLVQRGDLALSVVATGSVVPVSTVEVKSKASGLVKNLMVEEGDAVRAGQTLIELDKELLQAQLREAEANLMAAQARLQEAESEVSSAATMKKKLQLDLRNLEGNLEFIGRQLKRQENMFDEKLIPRSDYEKTERDLQDASLKAEALKSELLMQDARIQGATKAVNRVRAEVVQSEANLDRQRENLSNATITSPIAGKLLKRHVEVGDAVSSILQLGSQATLLLTLGDMTEVFVEGRVDEADIGKVFVGQECRVKVDSYRERTFPGRVTRIAPMGEKIDNVIGFKVRVSITDTEQILRAEMSANAEIIIQEKRNILIVPESAIIYDKLRKTYAQVYDPSAEGMKRRVPIEVGISNGTSTEVVGGLTDGDQVVRGDKGGLI